jgi:hypothetical protein
LLRRDAMKRMLLADMDAVVLAAAGLLVAAGILLHVWGRLRWIP